MKAIIDLGTNTFHLLIAEVIDGEIVEHKKLQIPVKLGEGGINQHLILPPAYDRGMDALRQFRETLNQFNIGKVTAHGTSAIRDAENGLAFMQQAESLYQIHIKMISGDEEAAVIYKGVSHSFTFPDRNVLVMDIGGGSVEFIIGNKETILWKKSYPIGAARLVERFHQSDPISDEEIITLQSYLVHNIIELRDALHKYPTTTLIGSAGSFETLTEVLRKDLQKGVTPISEHADKIDLETFFEYAVLIPSLNKEDRSKLHGMINFRVEMIVVATILMDVIIKRFEMEQLIASHYSLKEGLLFS
jgi:exopolyphosphatase / guanosine-5'-triphosphate,3'-diphosphate pyrophosphatase